MTKNTQQSAYTLPDSAKSTMRDLIRQNEGPIPHPYLDSKGIITIGVGFNVDNKADFLKLNLRKDSEEGVLMTEQEKRDAYDAMRKAKTDRNGDFSPGEKYYEDVAKAYLSDADINARLDQEIADRVPKICDKVGSEAWDKLTDGQKATITAVHFNVGSLDDAPKLVEAAKKGDAAAIARESHVVAKKVTNEKGEVTKHERNWGAVMRNHCGALGLDAGSDACWRSVAAEYKDKPEDQRKLETFHPSIQKILDEPAKPEEKKPDLATQQEQPQEQPQPQPEAAQQPTEPPLEAEPQPQQEQPKSTEPPLEAEPTQQKQSDLGTDGQAFLERIRQPNTRPALDVAAKEPQDWTKEEADTVIQHYQRYPRPESLNAWLRDQASEHFKSRYGDVEMIRDLSGRMVERTPLATTPPFMPGPDPKAMQKALEQIGGKLAPVFDADGTNSATRSMQQGLNLLRCRA
ncbi:MAG: hypothetical protein OEL53_09635 [Rhodospirillales bacterium]|nr:hypothetical protein [Rhodospirillales bacterium]